MGGVVQINIKEDSDDCFITEIRNKTPSKITPQRKRKTTSTNHAHRTRTMSSVQNQSSNQNPVKKEKGISSLCGFCGEEECHDFKFGSYCRNVCIDFLKDKRNSNVTRSTLFGIFQSTYGCVLNWELHKTDTNVLVNRNTVTIHVVPECMMNGSYTHCLLHYCNA